MVAFTPNRNYPYSTAGDPADVPQALQDFAEAVDDDLETRDAVIRTRPYAKLRGAGTVTFPVNVQTPIPFEIEDFDTDSMADLTVSRTLLTVRTAGLYWVHARARIYVTGAVPANPFVLLILLENGATAFGVNRMHSLSPGSPNYFDVSVSGLGIGAVDDTFSVALHHNIPTYTELSRFRELSAFRVAN